MTDTEKKAIVDAYEHHILFDTIIMMKESEESHEMRILSFKESAAALTIALFSLISSEIITISLELAYRTAGGVEIPAKKGLIH